MKFIIDITILDNRPGGADWTSRSSWPEDKGLYYCKDTKDMYLVDSYINYIGSNRAAEKLLENPYVPEAQVSESLFLKALAACNGR